MMKNRVLVIVVLLVTCFYFGACGKDKEESNSTNVESSTTTISSSFTEFTIAYELNGGTNSPNNPTTYRSGDSAFVLASPTKVNFEFWVGIVILPLL